MNPSHDCTRRIEARGAALAALLGGSVALLAACDQGPAQQAKSPAPPSVTVAKPVVKDIVEWDEFVGRYDALESVELRARVSGYLQSVHFRDGALVKKGDLLFIIDPRPFQAAVDEAAAAVTRAEGMIVFAAAELKRAETLVRTSAAPERQLDERRQQNTAARADLERAKAQLVRARLDLEFTEIRAPIDGRISRKLVSEGDLVAGGADGSTLLTTIVALDPIYFYFDVDERSYLGYVRMSQSGERPSSRDVATPVEVALADEKTFAHKGKMDFVDNRIDAATGTMRGRAVFENKDLQLTPGLFGRLRLPGTGAYRGVLVPDEAVASDQDRRVVYVVAEDGTVSARPVRLAQSIDGYRVVREGLKGDETIVVNGLMRVRPGGKVAPKMTTLPPQR
ncbi:MAG: efflux RND transporter periplasmic adaptor subunit [Rhodospirillales bacterium]